MKRLRKRRRIKVNLNSVSKSIDSQLNHKRDVFNQLITSFLNNNPSLQSKSWMEKKNAFKEHIRERKIFSSSLWKYKSY